MRWDRLFDDLEAQAAGQDARARASEVADRTRRERALLHLHTRLLANVDGPEIVVRLPRSSLTGRLVDVGPDWVLLEDPARHSLIVSLPAVRAVSGLAAGARTPSVVAKRFGLGSALRAVSRDRAAVEVADVDGQLVTGTIDVVGADHLELAEHPAFEPRRRDNVTRRLVLPFWALCTVRRL